MSKVRQIVLDVLKPHHPTVLEFAQALADLGTDYKVSIDVTGVDEKTESVVIEVTADCVDFAAISDTISGLGGSVHSIDRVDVHGESLTPSSD